MICPVCQVTNKEDANFCTGCNFRLSIVCPRCSRRVVSQAKYCDRCGLAVKGVDGWLHDQSGEEETVRSGSIERVSKTDPIVERTQNILREEEQTQSEKILPTPTQEEKVSESVEKRSGASSPLERYIPRELFKKLESARSSGDMVGERRVVTMLFCDVKGSTQAAEHLDPEEWSEIINGAFEHMIRPVFKYEGTVARLMGDGILAFFGAPLAHEDDPQRAVLAGLDILAKFTPYKEEILQEWGFEIEVRIGINTGLVVVGTVGSDMRMEYTALGDAINLAARMEQTASPGTIQISHDTYKLVKPMFEFESLGGISVKGKDEPVDVYRVLGRKSGHSRARGIEGLHAEMVGREREMEVLHKVVDRLKQGVGRIIFVLGEAGLGKSRLVSETKKVFVDMMKSEDGWYETNSLSYETNQAYALVQRMIQKVSGIRYDDAPRMIHKKLEPILDDVPEEMRSHANMIFETLFGLDSENGKTLIDGEEFRQELFDVMDVWLRARFSETPTVFVFDDMHWSDAASSQLIKQMLQLTEVIPVVFICAMRVDISSPAWGVKISADDQFHHRYTEISLKPLSEADSNELINRLLAIAEIHDELRQSILEKSDGNPFFIEEVVRALIENAIVIPEKRVENGVTNHYWISVSDGSDFSIPDNLQSLLAARMDQLEESTRATLQLASVIGRNFYLRVLQAVNTATPELDKQVGTLLRLDMIRESARVPEVEYSFRNPLTQEAVYQTILLKHRREFHLRVAEAMEALYQDRLEGKYGLLAHHFSLAGKSEKAIDYCRRASRQAVSVYAYEEAEKNLRVALSLLKNLPDDEVHALVLEELADVCWLVRNFVEAISIYQEALEKWENLSDGDRIVHLRLNQKIVKIVTEAKWSVDAATFEQVSEVSKQSHTSLQQSLKAMSGKDPHPETVRMLVALSTDAWRVQTPVDWGRAQQYAEEAVKFSEQLEDKDLLSFSLGALATALDGQSLLREHLEIATRRSALRSAGENISEYEQIDALRGMGAAHLYVGEYSSALPYLDEAIVLATNVRSPDQIANATGLKAQCLFRMDKWDEVLEVENQWRDLDRRYTRQRVGET
jgi:class 3 adenylate cyclase/tetratricopeptide (TPR) repeat protein